MPLNKGYLTVKTDKASDETYTPAYAVRPLVKYVQDYMKRNNKSDKVFKKNTTKENGELRQPKHNNRKSFKYMDDYDEAMETLNSYVGNFRF